MKIGRYDPYKLGYTCATIFFTKRSKYENISKSLKKKLNTNYRLKLIYMKLESLVIVNEYVTVNHST